MFDSHILELTFRKYYYLFKDTWWKSPPYEAWISNPVTFHLNSEKRATVASPTLLNVADSRMKVLKMSFLLKVGSLASQLMWGKL